MEEVEIIIDDYNKAEIANKIISGINPVLDYADNEKFVLSCIDEIVQLVKDKIV